MPRPAIRAAVAALSLLFLAGCASHPPRQRVWMHPRIDLKPLEILGVVEFSSNAKGELASMATRRFAEAARRDQDLVRMVSIGQESQALASVGRNQWNAESCRAIARRHGARTLVHGTLTLSGVKPTLQASAFLRSGQVTAQVDATLEVEMIEAETGAQIWSRSSQATRTVGQVSVFGGKNFVFDAADPEAAYGDMIDFLVNQVASDLQGHWVTQ